MARTAAELTDDDLKAYRLTARLREQRDRKEPMERITKAWALARRAADLLRGHFGAARVVVFGSLVREGCFTPWSDVDLAAWGLKPADTFRAIGMVHCLDPDVESNLVDVNTCSATLKLLIEAEGRDV